MTDDNSNRYVLEAVDSATASTSHEVSFEIEETAELCAVLDIPTQEFQANASYPLETSDVSKLKTHYHLQFDSEGYEVWLRHRHPGDDLPYKAHTGRELAMMLAGTKPLTVFTDEHPKHHELDIIPEREFEPHVRARRIIKHQTLVPPAPHAPVINGEPIGLRRVLYALPGQEWRIDAYLQLWETCKKTGWTAALEREQGTLLGYEDWQNDIHMKEWNRLAPRIPNP